MQSDAPATVMLFDAVAERLSELIERFGVEAQRELILTAYGLLCREALTQPAHIQPPGFSRLNTDGTPLQFSLSLSPSRPSPLQFLAEAGVPGITMKERISIGREKIRGLAALFSAADELAATEELLEEMAPECDTELIQNQSGVYWTGVSLPTIGPPALTIYVNSRWGAAEAQWKRARIFAAWFGVLDPWRQIEQKLRGEMALLGTAITVARGRPPTGRLYASAYGLRLDYYRTLLGEFVPRFAEALLGEDCAYPLRSTACSFEVASGVISGAKFEICGHCAFSSDSEASAHLLAWLNAGNGEGSLYADTLEILTRGKDLSNATLPEVHAYVGCGFRSGETYTSVYLNPGPPLRGQ